MLLYFIGICNSSCLCGNEFGSDSRSLNKLTKKMKEVFKFRETRIDFLTEKPSIRKLSTEYVESEVKIERSTDLICKTAIKFQELQQKVYKIVEYLENTENERIKTLSLHINKKLTVIFKKIAEIINLMTRFILSIIEKKFISADSTRSMFIETRRLNDTISELEFDYEIVILAVKDNFVTSLDNSASDTGFESFVCEKLSNIKVLRDKKMLDLTNMKKGKLQIDKTISEICYTIFYSTILLKKDDIIQIITTNNKSFNNFDDDFEFLEDLKSILPNLTISELTFRKILSCLFAKFKEYTHIVILKTRFKLNFLQNKLSEIKITVKKLQKLYLYGLSNENLKQSKKEIISTIKLLNAINNEILNLIFEFFIHCVLKPAYCNVLYERLTYLFNIRFKQPENYLNLKEEFSISCEKLKSDIQKKFADIVKKSKSDQIVNWIKKQYALYQTNKLLYDILDFKRSQITEEINK
ncbi:hypothetical protein TUBRATIS_24820 [Tubulinosema ratisbonensis]|uniref:Uncharacterized protein n=1 Tax=Tubulinosema ratisbonensis TaxID=291195 RepID=A0A437AJ30_9MICR|nr:hypothetical protein TUBRATIS_24820 [Tubulinosema ratisbonensis]